ncbi:hypothetical protein JCM3770_002144 [Rhodotorula araucariae]
MASEHDTAATDLARSVSEPGRAEAHERPAGRPLTDSDEPRSDALPASSASTLPLAPASSGNIGKQSRPKDAKAEGHDDKDHKAEPEDAPASKRPIYPVINPANSRSPAISPLMLFGGGLAVTHLSPEEQNAEWRAEQDKNRGGAEEE